MNNSFIPIVFKDKFIKIIIWAKGLFFLFLSISLFLSIFTFDINDDSFLTSTNGTPSNILGFVGSYVASFLIYSFGIMSYIISLFLLINSIAIFLNKDLNYFFIRLLFFLISIVFIPQLFFYWEFRINFINQINVWGEISSTLYGIHQIESISYIISLIGIFIFC